ncbi:hypothetical protein F8388_004741 [Cannabis sativa]|uniref:Uncharacterized protein n=3 Tax=Cannabis sativa TaxID=3483 RepID=A0A7J6HNG2_CANSA|nr:hypothetical protein F8388_004741 [Cannabis sativa]
MREEISKDSQRITKTQFSFSNLLSFPVFLCHQTKLRSRLRRELFPSHYAYQTVPQYYIEKTQNIILIPPYWIHSIAPPAAMDSLSSVFPSLVLPPNNSLCPPQRRQMGFYISCRLQNCRRRSCSLSRPRLSSPVKLSRRSWSRRASSKSDGGGGTTDDDKDDNGTEEVERALHLDGAIPGTSDEFVKQVSSRAYDMRRHLQQTFDSSSYDVVDSNPWRDPSKPVYVLTQRENQLCTMKIRINRSEVEKELGMLFSKGGKLRSGIGNQTEKSESRSKFQMLVEDVREGLLVFEDENEAVKYCDLLQGGGKGCEGVAEIEASSVFDLVRKMKALAVLFRRGRTPPLPQSLELNLKARRRSLEDQEDSV